MLINMKGQALCLSEMALVERSKEIHKGFPYMTGDK